MAVVRSSIIATMDLAASSTYERYSKIRCALFNEDGYHPIAFKIWIAQLRILAHCITCLTIWLAYKLYMIEKRSTALLSRTILSKNTIAVNITDSRYDTQIKGLNPGDSITNVIKHLNM